MNPVVSAAIRLALTSASLVLCWLPRPAELALGKALGRLALAVAPKRRRIAYDNIRRCLPELGEKGWRRLLRENYEHYGVLALELLHMFCPIPGHFREYTQRVTVCAGLENWRKAHERGKGVLFVSAHLANWELMAARSALHGMPITIATRRLKPEWLLKKIESSRLSAGVHAAYVPRTMPIVIKRLREGKSVGFVLDQYAPPPMGVSAPFFGVRVDTLAAVGPLAQRTGAAIIPVYQRRDQRGIVHVVFEPELDLGPAAADAERSTALMASKIEAWIRKEPAQWLWGHRRFKNVVWPEERTRSPISA